MTITAIAPIPSTALRPVPWLTDQGQIICPVCGDPGMVRRSTREGDSKAQWKCDNGHYSQLPAAIKTRWIIVIVPT